MKYFLLLGATCLSLTGCMVGPDFKSPPPPQTAQYTEEKQPTKTVTADAVAQHFKTTEHLPLEWWTLFHSPELDQLVRQALSNSPTLDAAEARLRQARENLLADRGTLWPAVNFNPSITRERFSPSSFGEVGPPDIFTLYNVSVNVSYGVDIWGAVRRQLEADVAGVDYAAFQLEAAHLALTANVVTAAIQAASLQAQVQTQQDLIRIAKKQLEIMVQQFQLGAKSRPEVLAQETLVAQMESQLPPLESQFSSTRHLLAVLIGKLPSEAVLPSLDLNKLKLPPDLPLTCPSELAHNRPDIRASEALLHQAGAKVGVATANLYPQITLSGSIGSEALKTGALFTGPSSVWSVGAGLLQPIFDGGTLAAKERAAIGAFDEAAANYRETVLSAFQNVADTLRALEADAKALQAQTAAAEKAKETLDIVKTQFTLGAASYLDLLDAERQYFETQPAVLQTRAARLADTAALFQALGGGIRDN